MKKILLYPQEKRSAKLEEFQNFDKIWENLIRRGAMLGIPENFHKNIYISALVLTAVSLPFSVFTLSVAQITLMVNWLVEGQFYQKWQIIKKRPAIWIVSLFYAVHLLGLFFTSDFTWGMHDLRIKLPLFVLPLVIGTSSPVNKEQLRTILIFFISAVFVGSLYSAYIIFGFEDSLIHSKQQTYPLISHIRWSLMIALAIISTVWLINITKSRLRWLYFACIIWLTAYIFLLHVLTGIVILIIASFVLSIRSLSLNKDIIYRWFIVSVLIAIFLAITVLLSHSYSRFYTFDQVDSLSIDRASIAGKPYYHDFKSKSVENGHYTYLYICEPELIKEWNKRSNLNYNGQTENKGELKHVLIRYLTSKGLRKDSVGLSHLSSREIKFIESGITNYIDTNRYSIYPIIYKVLWELHNYSSGANPSGYSIVQRIEFFKTGLHIIKNNFWWGVGTGDVPKAFAQQYVIDNSELLIENRFRAHNQILTFMVAFGPLGLLIILLSLLAPGCFEKKYSNFLFLTILMIGFLSFLDEDTLETHTGISFFAFFYALFLFYDAKET